ncbi:MAG TPA: DNA polymerase domain-containing protein [Methylomirabilota bacterium]|jgi:DNA polymerase elongation subunit (family B)|nr:DNA polymerase domain-containing protein [Methylomirabilota bacterium]
MPCSIHRTAGIESAHAPSRRARREGHRGLSDTAPLLFGADPTPGLVAFALTGDGRGIRVWRRRGETTESEVASFTPFLLLADPALIEGADGLVKLEPLAGPGVLRWRAHFASWSDALAARDAARQRSGLAPDVPAAPYRFMPDAVHQYLLASGRTSFGAMRFGDLRRMALDIEVVTGDGHEFPSALREADRIVAVALADTTGFQHVVRGDRLDERALLEETTRIIRERDPDVIEGHNIFRFDLEYLEARARRHQVRLAWGRDGSELRGRPARLQVAERSIGYRRYEIAGRHVADTWMLAQLHDVGARNLPSFGLKDIARHLGVAAPDRTYIDASRIAQELAESPDRLMAYAIDDALETLAIGAILAPPYFAQAQLLPFDYQSAALRGAAAKIDTLLVREYLRRGHAVPAPGPVQSVGGGLTAIWRQGVGGPVLHVDVTSLYPSLMLAERVAPVSDDLGVFLDLLDYLRDVRVRAKHLARSAPQAAERAHQHALQQTFKILINAFYGYLAFTGGHFNDFTAADRVTTEGRRVVTAIVDRLAALGATPIEADTDGVYFLAPPGHEATGDAALLDAIAEGLPTGIALELDGRHAAMLSYKMKTYALLDERGRVQLKGSGFRSRGLEPFQRLVIEEIVRLLLEGRRKEVRAVVDRWLTAFATHQVPLRQFARTETLQEAVDVYRQRVAANERPVAAAYELMIAAERSYQPGDQVSYYVAGRSRNVVVSEHARLAAEFDPARPDENVEHYQGKVLEIWERFRRFTETEGLVPYRDESAEDEAQLTLF